MLKNNSVVPQARAALDQFKMEAAREVDVPLHLKIYKPVKNNIKQFILRAIFIDNASESCLAFARQLLK
ncbi:MAG: small, acid-soluble spore protein, alpha/beta type [Clostridia bacterium]|nr:small, acid-soluble spore protein, alpha/beta type [Clostridia bacterium]